MRGRDVLCSNRAPGTRASAIRNSQISREAVFLLDSGQAGGGHNTPSLGHRARLIPLAEGSSSHGYVEEWCESGEDQTAPWKRQGSENDAMVGNLWTALRSALVRSIRESRDTLSAPDRNLRGSWLSGILHEADGLMASRRCCLIHV